MAVTQNQRWPLCIIDVKIEEIVILMEYIFKCIILFQMKSSDGEIQSDPITVWYRSMHNVFGFQDI